MPSRLSESVLWDDQRRWYEDRATSAWSTGLVPSGVLTGTRTARQYAEMVRAYVEDSLEDGIIDASEPLFVLDLGAGSGRLGWHLQRELYELLADVPGAPEPVVVLTDFSPSILEDWRAHPQAKHLAHALVDADEAGPIKLSDGTVLHALSNPLIAVASYFFDSLGTDVYEALGGSLSELHVDLTDSDVGWTVAPVLSYDDPVLNDVLDAARRGVRGAFLFPSTSVSVLERLRGVAPGGVLVIAADKAVCHAVGYDREHVMGLSHDGALSLRVNLHALGCWARLFGGQALFPTHHDPRLSVALLAVPGKTPSALRRLQRAYSEGVSTFGPLAYRAVQSAIVDGEIDLDSAIAVLKLSCWEPDVVLALEDRLTVEIERASPALRNELREALPKIAERGFLLDQRSDLYSTLARLAVCLGDLRWAVRFLEHSLTVFGHRADTWHNLSVLYSQAGRANAAAEAKERSEQLTV
ncbi:MAG: hypothetical protein ACI9MC_000237 [Kiritimatiellia bacterium]|jgi:hypothetical protein